MPRSNTIDWLILVALAVAWGSAFGGLKIVVQEVPPIWHAAIRLWIAAGTLALVSVMQNAPPSLLLRSHSGRWNYALAGVLGLAAPFSLFGYAVTNIPSAVAAICHGATPILTAVLAAALVGDEKFGRLRVAGIMLGFVGLLTLVAPRLPGGGTVQAVALASAVAGAGCYAVANIVVRRAPPADATVGALTMCLGGAAAATLAALLIEQPLSRIPSAPTLFTLVALGVVPTALAQIGYVFLVNRQGPVFVTMANYMAPLWATFVGAVILLERLDWTAFAALALILAGVGLANTARRAD